MFIRHGLWRPRDISAVCQQRPTPPRNAPRTCPVALANTWRRGPKPPARLRGRRFTRPRSPGYRSLLRFAGQFVSIFDAILTQPDRQRARQPARQTRAYPVTRRGANHGFPQHPSRHSLRECQAELPRSIMLYGLTLPSGRITYPNLFLPRARPQTTHCRGNRESTPRPRTLGHKYTRSLRSTQALSEQSPYKRYLYCVRITSKENQPCR